MKTSSTGNHGDWHGILIGISNFLQCVQSNIYAVHFSIKWDLKSKENIVSESHATKVQNFADLQCFIAQFAGSTNSNSLNLFVLCFRLETRMIEQFSRSGPKVAV